MSRGRTDMPPGPGRPAGIANKATLQAREAIAMFVEGNVHRLNEWLDAIALESPKDAFDRFMAVVEYHIPKLARTELSAKQGDVVIETVDVTKRVLKQLPMDALEDLSVIEAEIVH